ncbi:hypothetical protein [Streptacidiphilus rugosus]|uniref:hypothetical protein n=1 Tax=Streptacidiphilus rugosus TaxID=405783 RepID=UPI0012FB364D|nr:hypothetical protein [Streptacidiphilus rugosus]
MTSDDARPLRRSVLRGLPIFLISGALGSVAYRMAAHRVGSTGVGAQWGGLLFGAAVFTLLSLVFRRPRKS